MILLGASQLRARLMAVREPKGVEDRWAQLTAPIMRSYVPVRTGRSRASVRPRNNLVLGSAVVNVLDAGSKAHDIEAKQGTLKFQLGGQTLFRKKVHKPQQRGQHFKRRAAEEGARKLDMAGQLVKGWNDAA